MNDSVVTQSASNLPVSPKRMPKTIRDNSERPNHFDMDER